LGKLPWFLNGMDVGAFKLKPLEQIKYSFSCVAETGFQLPPFIHLEMMNGTTNALHPGRNRRNFAPAST